MSTHFISYASKDQQLANKLVEALERQGVCCWIAPRNIPPGANYGSAILSALDEATSIVVLYSKHAAASEHVVREVEIALNNNVAIIPVIIDRSPVTGSLKYFLATKHWLNLTKNDDDNALVARMIVDFDHDHQTLSQQHQSGDRSRRRLIIGLAAIVLLLLIALGGYWATVIYSESDSILNRAFVLHTKEDKPIVLYESPTIHNRQIGRIKRGSHVFIEEETEDYNGQKWLRISIDEGWIAIRNLNQPEYEMVKPDGTTELTVGHNAFINYAGSDGLFLRESPHYQARIIAKLLQRTQLKVVNDNVPDSRGADHQWLAVEVPSAWILLNKTLILRDVSIKPSAVEPP